VEGTSSGLRCGAVDSHDKRVIRSAEGHYFQLGRLRISPV